MLLRWSKHFTNLNSTRIIDASISLFWALTATIGASLSTILRAKKSSQKDPCPILRFTSQVSFSIVPGRNMLWSSATIGPRFSMTFPSFFRDRALLPFVKFDQNNFYENSLNSWRSEVIPCFMLSKKLVKIGSIEKRVLHCVVSTVGIGLPYRATEYWGKEEETTYVMEWGIHNHLIHCRKSICHPVPTPNTSLFIDKYPLSFLER